MFIPTAVVEAAGGVGAILFDSTLGADAASIDTGAAGIAGGYDLLEIYILARTTEAVELSTALITFNNDTGSNYDRQEVSGANITASAGVALAAANILINVPGGSALAGSAGLCVMWFPGYTQTTFHKVGNYILGSPEDTAANNRVRAVNCRWRNTAAITRMAVAAGSGNLLAGSRLLIYGR